MKQLILIFLVSTLVACQSKKEPVFNAYGDPILTNDAAALAILTAQVEGKDSVTLTLKGKIEKTCAKKGCWMTVQDYADRYKDGRSYTTYVDLDRANPSNILYYHKKPILPFGAPGTFDDDGVMPSYALRRDGQVYLYYSGWNRGLTVPYRNSVGIAVSDDDGATFRRLYEGPVLERCPKEPYIAVTPTIVKVGSLWRMWYISGVRWVEVEGKYEPVYVIKYASSQDGISWDRPNHLCILPSHDTEAFSHPSVIKDGDRYRMWYCFRNSRDYRDGAGAYRIGYAESADGLEWERLDDVYGLPVAAKGWDSTMTCYPFVMSIDGRIVMFYNGNGFGKSGFGYAILEEK